MSEVSRELYEKLCEQMDALRKDRAKLEHELRQVKAERDNALKQAARRQSKIERLQAEREWVVAERDNARKQAEIWKQHSGIADNWQGGN